MAEFYHLIEDINELNWWWEHTKSELRDNESFMVCLSARNKKLDENERKIYNLSRSEMMRTEIISKRDGEWNFNIWLSALMKYECDKRAMLITKAGIPYPDKCLVVYDFLNPSNECACISDFSAHVATIQKELLDAIDKGSKEGIKVQYDKLIHSGSHLKSCHAQNISRKLYMQYDFDMHEDCNERDYKLCYSIIHNEAVNHFGKGNFFIIRTGGGFHVVVKMKAFGKDQETSHKKEKIDGFVQDYLYDVVEYTDITYKEANRTQNLFVPCPGTLQYGKLVKVLNKEDFQ